MLWRTGILALLATGALFFSCEQPAGPIIPKEEESPPKIAEKPEPVRYRAAANGVNGEEDSTVILFTFDEDVADLKAGNISLVNGGGDVGGRVVKGALSGSGKEWSLGIAALNAGSVTVAVKREDIEEGEKPVTVYKAAEIIRISYHAAADGGNRKTSAAINFTFGAAIAELSAEDITIAGDTGRVTTGGLSGSGQNWSLGIAVETPGNIKVGIAREGIETGERAVEVYKPMAYSAEADGAEGEGASTKINFAFTGAVSGLTAGDISISPAENITKGGLTGSGQNWSLGIRALKAGDAQVSIHKDGIEDRERTVALYFQEKPISYTAIANGVNGEENSTAITFTFDEAVPGLWAGAISLTDSEDGAGGKAVKGALEGSGKQWSLGITVEKAGSITVRVNRTGVEAMEKPVTVYKAQERAIVGFSAAADGNSRRVSSAINFSFGAVTAGLTTKDIVITGDTGSVAPGALSGGGQNWSLGIVVATPGDIKVHINREGIETGEKIVAVYKPAVYSLTTDGAAALVSSTKIDFAFNADITGLTTGDMVVSPADSVITGALTGGGSNWSLGITPLKAGEIRVRIQKDGIEDREKTTTVHQYKPISYAAAANGVNGTEDSTAIAFVFDEDVYGLGTEHLSLVNGTGRVAVGSLAGSGKNWTLGITVESAGSVGVALHKTGIEAGEKTVDVYKAAEQTLISFNATADGGSRRASSGITLSFGEAVSLSGADIALVNRTGGATKGALSGSGKTWSLGIIAESAGDIGVSITKKGIEAGEKIVTLYKPITYEAAADRTAGAEASGRIDFVFSEAVDLNLGHISYSDATGSFFPMDFSGGGQEWSVKILVVKTGEVRVGIRKDGVEDQEKIVTVYKPEEVPPEVAVKTGITVISPPDITLYVKNQSFDRTGLEVGWVYSDGTIEPIAAGGYQLDEPDMSRASNKRVNVRAGGYTTSFWIQVLNTDKILTHISVEGPANKIQDLGREFNSAGLVVTGYYSDGSSSSLTSLAAIVGYNKYKRGAQTVSVRVNGKSAALEGISTRIGEEAYLGYNYNPYDVDRNHQERDYRSAWIKGEPFSPQRFNFIPTVHYPKEDPYARNLFGLTLENGGLTEQDYAALTGYNPYQAGKQTLSITLDGRRLDLEIYVMDTEPAVWFDYGYMRHAGDPTGHGPGEGKYYAKPNETLILAPVRYLMGYNADYSDGGASYAWTVSGDNSSRTWTTSKGGELLHITPLAAGTYTITVDVTGRNFITGSFDTKRASAELVCYTAPLPAGTFDSPLKNFGAGQMTAGGTGYGWSLGSAGGYEVWTVEHQPSYVIEGNAFGAWHEAGVVWMQEDNNGNGLPDEMWYELRGGDDDDSVWKNYITRRYAVTYFKGSDYGTTNEYGQYITEVYWADSRGRTGMIPGGFPHKWGVVGDKSTYTCTLLRDNGRIATSDYGGLLPMPGYVDALGVDFSVNKAMRADGTPITLTAVKFIKVQTGVFRYGGLYGDVSTEIQYADFLGTQSWFPKP
jgi:hypothetical protein